MTKVQDRLDLVTLRKNVNLYERIKHKWGVLTKWWGLEFAKWWSDLISFCQSFKLPRLTRHLIKYVERCWEVGTLWRWIQGLHSSFLMFRASTSSRSYKFKLDGYLFWCFFMMNISKLSYFYSNFGPHPSMGFFYNFQKDACYTSVKIAFFF